MGQPASQPAAAASVPTSSGPGAANSVLGPYPNDGSRRMPGANSLSAIEAGRRKRAQQIKRSGRSSTRLASSPGTQPYVNPTVGGTN